MRLPFEPIRASKDFIKGDNDRWYLEIALSQHMLPDFRNTFDGLGIEYYIHEHSDGRNGCYFGILHISDEDYFVWKLNGNTLDNYSYFS